jgi:uncharacterized membrane protein
MTTRQLSLQQVLLASAVLLWTAALTLGQEVGVVHVAPSRSASTATTTTPTQANMVYQGGPVLPNSTTYAVWWGNPADFPPDEVTEIDKLLNGLNGSSYLAIADQYMFGQKATTRFGGNLYNDSSPPPTDTNRSGNVFYGLCQFLHANGLQPEPTDIYFLFTSNFPTNQGFCGYHAAGTCTGTFSGNVSTPFQFAYIPNLTSVIECSIQNETDPFWGVEPYLAPNNYSDGTRSIASLTGHEFMETITDPHINAWRAPNGQEVGDPCAYTFQNWVPLTNSNWQLQEIWSNQVNGCVQSSPPVKLLGALSNSGTVTTFDIPGATYGVFGEGIAANGTIAGTYYDTNFGKDGYSAFVRDPLGNVTTFTVPGANETAARDINSSGTIAGTAGGHGFVRNVLGNITTFDAPTANFTGVSSINGPGAITGIYASAASGLASSTEVHGYVRDPLGDITNFDAPGLPDQTVPFSINDNGAVAGFYSYTNRPYHSFVRDPSGNITTFDVPGGVNGTEALSINRQGAIAGIYIDSNFVKHGFVRSPSGAFTTFDAPKAVYGTVAQSINNHGAVAGYYSDANGVSHGFVRDQYGNFTILSDIPKSINDAGMTTGYKTVAIK